MLEDAVTSGRCLEERELQGIAEREERAKYCSDVSAVFERMIPFLDRQHNAPSTIHTGRQEYEYPAAFTNSKAKQVWYRANGVVMERLLLLRRLMDWATRQQKVVQRDGRYYGVVVARAADLARWWECSEPTARQTMADLARWAYAHDRGVVYDGQARIGTAYMLGRRHAGVGLARPAWTWIEPVDKVVPGNGEIHELTPAVPDWASIPLHPDQLYRFSYDDAMNAVSATME